MPTEIAQELRRPEYRPDIDGLRAVAVLSVVGFHAFPSQIPGGFAGVDVFFVISGYLITRIILDNLERGSFRFMEFYGRRARRIFPALLVVIASCYAAGWFILSPEEFKQLGKHIAGGAGFVANLVLWAEAGYFDSLGETKPLLHLWSLGIEEQFYLAWPFILWFAAVRRTSLPLAIMMLGAVSFGANLEATGRDAAASFYGPHTRIWELLSGGFLAWLTLQRRVRGAAPLSPAVATALSVLGGVLLVVAFWGLDNRLPYPGGWALIPVSGTVLLMGAGPGGLLNRTVLDSRVAVWFGVISYPLYLWHWPLLTFARILKGSVPAEVCAGLVAVSVGLAWCVYRFIEQPVRSGGQGGLKAAVLVVAMAGIGGAGYHVLASDGLPSRNSATVSATVDPNPHVPLRDSLCGTLFPQFEGFDACRLSRRAMPEVLLIGDSHANQYYNAVARHLPGKAVMSLSHWHCLPFATAALATRRTCAGKAEAALELAMRVPSINVVFVAGYWSYLASGGFETVNQVRRPVPLRPDSAESFVESGVDAIGALLRSGKRVIFMHDIPDLDFAIRSCSRAPQVVFSTREVRTECSMKRVGYELRYAPYAALLDRITSRFPALEEYSPRDLFCKNVSCSAARGDELMYFDSDHLTLEAADMVVQDLLAKHPVP